jgi:hypothetical protein
MSRKVRITLIVTAAAVVIFTTVWILYYGIVQSRPTGSDVRFFGIFENFPISFSTSDLGADGLASDSDEATTESHVEIEGVDPTPTSTPEFEAPAPVARPSSTLICYAGPRTCDPPFAILTPDHLFPVDRRAYEGLWLRLILVPTDLSCWVFVDFLDVSGDVDHLPELDPMPWPCPTVTPTEPPPGCWVIDVQHPNGYCRPGTCTPNDFPGTTCTPP